MHNKTRARFSRGDKEIIDAMVEFAGFAEEAKLALENGDHRRFGELMNMNFDLRRKIYGDDAIGEKNLQMIEIARSHGAPVKFPGSGGAVIGMYDSEEQFDRLRTSYLNQGLRFAKAIPLGSDFPV
jgi:glucuronokinase